ncbi:MAG TPA: hypothetical protein VER12_07375 [Polyangiaceae bacterium]|nr:hypothetical protein [Polyangiaceae bacterium]
MNETEAYAAMFAFLEAVYERTKSDDLGALLGGMSLLEDGATADPSAWTEWKAAVRKVKERRVTLELDLRDPADASVSKRKER